MDTSLMVLLVLLYFTPTFFAFGRSHNSALAIAACNLILGWTVLGFIFSLIWSLTGNVKTPT